MKSITLIYKNNGKALTKIVRNCKKDTGDYYYNVMLTKDNELSKLILYTPTDDVEDCVKVLEQAPLEILQVCSETEDGKIIGEGNAKDYDIQPIIDKVIEDLRDISIMHNLF